MEPTPRTVAEHLAAVLALVAPLPPREVRLADLIDGTRPDDGDPCGTDGARHPAPSSDIRSILAADVHATTPVPAFDHSAMDGYAVRRADLPPSGAPVTLHVMADIAAAPGTPHELAPGTAARIMTGAPLPPGADAVVPVEHTSTGRFDPAAPYRTRPPDVATGTAPDADTTTAPNGGPPTGTTVTLARQPRDHIRRQGSDLPAGTPLAHAGTRLTAPLVAGLAASGVARIQVRRRPRVAVIATGSELVPLGQATGPGQITDSNSVMLATAIHALGADTMRLGPVQDTPDALATTLDTAVDTGVDLIVTAGGVSAGTADVVRVLLAAPSEAVTHVHVAAVGMRPGRPQALARWRAVPWIAVPGTPVAAYVSCAMFVRPAIERLRGLARPEHPARPHPAAIGWTSPPGREQVVPVRLTDHGITPTGDNHHLSALITADALALVPADVEKVAPGDQIPVIPL